MTLCSAGDERVRLFARVVEAERRAARGGHVEAHHQRLRAVMAGADGDAFLVEDRADVVRMHAFEHERDHRRLLRAPCR